MKSLPLHGTLFAAMLLLAAVGSASAGLIHSNSFENPIVSGSKVKTAPDGWGRSTAGAVCYDYAGLSNVDSNTFTTPFGAQAACVFYHTAALTTKETTFSDALWTGITYTVTFHVAKGSDLSGNYKVELIALSTDVNRYYDDAATALKSVSGTATASDMSETGSFTFGPVDAANTHIGKILALQIEGDGALVDNLVFSDDTVSDVVPPALMNLSPKDDVEWIPVDENLVVTFNENVTSGSGNIEIRRTSDNSLVEAIPIGSANVSFNGATVTIDPSADLSEGIEYYVLFDNGAIRDLTGNNFELTDTTKWSFTTTQPDGIRELFYESFEDPLVTGLAPKPTVPPGWVRVIGDFNSDYVTLHNEDTGAFSTPYGAQAFISTYNKRADLITDTDTIKYGSYPNVYEPDVTYTLKFNAAVTNGSPAHIYDVQLVYYEDAEDRTAAAAGTLVASVSGSVTSSDMCENSGLVLTVPAGAAYLGKKIAIKLNNPENSGGFVLIDNLKLTDNVPAKGTVLIIK